MKRLYIYINSLPHNKFLDLSKLKAFADYKLDLAEKLKTVLERVENIVGKRENAGFSFSHNVLKKLLFQDRSVGIVW